MSFLLFLLLVAVLYLAYRYINAHENLVRKVEASLATTGNSPTRPEPEPFDLKDKLVAGLQGLQGMLPK